MSDGGEGKTPRLDLNVIKERMKTIREALPDTGSSEPLSSGIENEVQASSNGDLSLKLQDGQTSQQTPKPPSESADEGGGQAPRGSASSTQDVPNVEGESSRSINKQSEPVPPVPGQADVIQQILLSLQKLGQQVGSLQQRQDELARKETSSSSPTSIDLGTPGASRALVSSAAQHSEQELNVLSSPSPLLAFDSTSKQQADSTGDIPEFVGQDTKNPTHHNLDLVVGRQQEDKEEGSDDDDRNRRSTGGDDEGPGKPGFSSFSGTGGARNKPHHKRESPARNLFSSDPHKLSEAEKRHLDVQDRLGKGRVGAPGGKEGGLKMPVGLNYTNANAIFVGWFHTTMSEATRRDPSRGFTAVQLLTLALSHLEQVFVHPEKETPKSLKANFLSLIGKVLGYPTFSTEPEKFSEVECTKYRSLADFHAVEYTFQHRGKTLHLTWAKAIEDLFINTHLKPYFKKSSNSTDANAAQDEILEEVRAKVEETKRALTSYSTDGYTGSRVSLCLIELSALHERLEAISSENDFCALQKRDTADMRKAINKKADAQGLWFQAGIEVKRAFRESDNFWTVKYKGQLILEILAERENEVFGVFEQDTGTGTGESKAHYRQRNTNSNNNSRNRDRRNNQIPRHTSRRNSNNARQTTDVTNGVQSILHACVVGGSASVNNTGGPASKTVSTAITALLVDGIDSPSVLQSLISTTGGDKLSPGQLNALDVVLCSLNATYQGEAIKATHSEALANARRLVAIAKANEFRQMHSGGKGNTVTDAAGITAFFREHTDLVSKLKRKKAEDGTSYFDATRQKGAQWHSNIPKPEYLQVPPIEQDMLRVLRLWHNWGSSKIREKFTPKTARYGSSKLREFSRKVGKSYQFGNNRGNGPTPQANNIGSLNFFGGNEYNPSSH